MRKMYIAIILITVICSYSQPFTEIDAGLAGIGSTSADWGDYDNDGDLDILLLRSSVSTVYRNDTGVFSDINAGMNGGASDGHWGDYDNDGDLDIALCGSGISKIYRNDSGVFTDINAALTGVTEGSVAWGDYDRDGDPDLLLTGLSSAGFRISYVYRNDSGIFTNINAGLTGVYRSSAEWGDFDNDGDLDILLSGNYDEYYVDHTYFQIPATLLYQNNGDDIFLGINAGLQAVEYSNVAWGDYDNDGDLDILLTGYEEFYDYYSRVYRNDAGVFTDINAGLTGIEGSVTWGDYDNDGDLDILLSGYYRFVNQFPVITKIYRNENGVFSDIIAGLTGIGQVFWGDYDNDGDLDFLRTGNITSIFRNNSTVANSKPSTPTSLISELNEAGVVLSWNKASDNETPQNGLSYNIYIGSASQTGDICDAMSNMNDGKRKKAKIGNLNQNTFLPINQLADGEYFWSVQAIDHAFSGSEFALESSFIINCGLPSTPVALIADSFIHSFNANWETSDTVLGYYLDVATDINFSSYVSGYNNLYVRKETGYTVTGLESDRTYYYRVRSYNPNGLSGNSNIVSVHTIVDPFSEISLSITELNESSVVWGDYDNDGDLDILLTGNNSTFPNYYSRLYRNDSGVFTDINAGLTGVYRGSVAWGDYDNDGDLDILLTGYTDSVRISKIYRNDSGVFTDINAGLTGVEYGSVVWGDYDNDGDLDILLTGYTGSIRISIIYRNDSGVFTDINAGLIGVSIGDADWGDYDNDGDLDILLTGETSSYTDISKVYRNDSGLFTDINAGLTAVSESSVAWGDYDNDGDLDILLTGSFTSKIYRNDAGVFTDINAGLTGVNRSSVAWGDYDNDGDLDFLLTGLSHSSSAIEMVTQIYINNGNSDFTDINSDLTGIQRGSVVCGDYDNDGDLDILISGWASSSSNIIKIYKNNSIIVNTKPNPPANLATALTENGIVLSWDKSSDAETPQDGLSYNIYIGSTSQTGNVFSPMSDILSGYRKVISFGNAQQKTLWTIPAFENGTYYWSVQTIDNNYVGSQFAPEETFTINYVNPDTPLANQATDVTDSEFIARWQSSYGALGYYLDIATDSLFVNFIAGYENVDVKNFTAKKISGLEGNTDYFYRVRAYNGENISENSNTIYIKTQWTEFTDTNLGLIGVSKGDADWGDYDNDGDLDILLTGKTSSYTDISKVYRNDSGLFTDINAGLTGVSESSVAWGDYDNDGDLDILLTGSSSSGRISKIYRNDNGVFADINAGLTGIAYGSTAWGDYDNDGDLDILLTGSFTSKIYRNDSGIFTDINAGLTGFEASSVDWGDYDKDGDLDILITGYTSYSVSKIYKNDSGIFTDINAGLTGVSFGDAEWGDYDNDGCLDIVISGTTGGGTYPNFYSSTIIYHNNGNGTFTETNSGIDGVYDGSTEWGDYDNDGDLDLLLSGCNGSSNISVIYRNVAGIFTDFDAGLTGVEDSSVAWGDYDCDGDLDILISGSASLYSKILKIYKNNSIIVNTKPNPPSTLSTDYTENGIVLSWDKANDAETLQNGLSYNIYIGSTSQTENIYSPMSDIFTGNRKIVSIGNVNQNTSWTVKNLPTGEYFWSVQAIDHTFAGSEFASEQYFTSIEDNILPLITELYQNYPNPFNPETVIKYSLTEEADVKLTVYDITGREVTKLVDQKQGKGFHEAKFNADRLTSGMYFYRLSVNDKVVASKKMMMLK